MAADQFFNLSQNIWAFALPIRAPMRPAARDVCGIASMTHNEQFCRNRFVARIAILDEDKKNKNRPLVSTRGNRPPKQQKSENRHE
ncbi:MULTISPECIES: hypothetical protein [Azospirillum]|uniref:hypothetical protein n=1 Tax=Azospirillum TaxID=191 RepID=UPI0013B3EBBD|nr:hypothetical protein [Azospirillum brasilense]